jgi:hypothetical protein
MWFRNLFFLGLLGAGVAGLTALLYPPARPPRVAHFDPGEFQQSSFRDAIATVNGVVRKGIAEAELQPAPSADELTVIRRLSLALTGTIPSLQELRQLEAQPPEARLQWWLSGLFQDRRCADYLAERLARTYVGTENGPFIIYRRRRFVTWLSDQLMQNRPYDQVARDIIASDGIWTDRPAVNFVTVTIEPDNKKGPNPERLAGRVARAFLGVRIDCAQCHNHPFQKWTQHNFQGLAAFFGQTKQGFSGIYDDTTGTYTVENRKTGKHETIEPDVPFLKELLPAEGTRRQRLAAWLTDRQNGYFARAAVNRTWALLFGRPLVEPVDDLGTVSEVPPALQLLADDFVAHGYDLRHLIRVIAATEAFQRDSAADFEVTEAHEKVWAAFPLTRLRPEQVANGVIQGASLETVNDGSHIAVKVFRAIQENQFIQRYGDTGDDEFDGRGGTIPQRLLLMNGELVKNHTQQNLANAATRIAALAPDDARAVETAYLTVLTRRPTAAEAAHFRQRLEGRKGNERTECLEDLYWTLLNSTEFSWNH